MSKSDHARIARDFDDAVNMTPSALEKWLNSEESRSVGWADGDTRSGAGGKEAVGHKSGQRIVEIRHKKQPDLTEDDYAQMKKVTGYVHRHLAQKPSGDIEHGRWRASLMNRGHDALKD